MKDRLYLQEVACDLIITVMDASGIHVSVLTGAFSQVSHQRGLEEEKNSAR